MSNSNNTLDMKKLTKKLNNILGAIDTKALEGLAVISYMEKNPDLDTAAKENLNRWKNNLTRVRDEV